MTQLPLHNSEWCSFFKKFTCCRVTECISAGVRDAQLVLHWPESVFRHLAHRIGVAVSVGEQVAFRIFAVSSLQEGAKSLLKCCWHGHFTCAVLGLRGLLLFGA